MEEEKLELLDIGLGIIRHKIGNLEKSVKKDPNKWKEQDIKALKLVEEELSSFINFKHNLEWLGNYMVYQSGELKEQGEKLCSLANSLNNNGK